VPRIRYPRDISIQGVSPSDVRAVFVEDGGVRIDNAGPFPPKEVAKLHRWLSRYLAAADVARRAQVVTLLATMREQRKAPPRP